jgi:hypothetical protein
MNPQELERTHADLWQTECTYRVRETKGGCEGQE